MVALVVNTPEVLVVIVNLGYYHFVYYFRRYYSVIITTKIINKTTFVNGHIC